ncbi:MAG: hypothetical protein DMF86_17855 [Acidobacteria bacterium]|nr:MAG: hypothetical protein DMF86_17855 [Acidobacteriota bacterium]
MKISVAAVCAVLAAPPVCAQTSEAALKQFFEGKTVTIKMDLPGTSDGVDVYPDARRPMDFDQYSARIKANGVAIHSGDAVMVTRVRLKEKLIEFQLAGGGFGTFGDDTSSSVYVPSTPKSERERRLERELKDEKDSARRREIRDEIDRLRRTREREDDRNRAVATVAEEQKRERIAQQRLRSGSRFNIRYQNAVPPGLGADGVMRALEDYVDFGGPRDAAASDRPPSAVELRQMPVNAGALHKGMSRQEVEETLGRPERESQRTEGTLNVITAVFSRGDQRIEAEFVEGVLIRYAISSR